MEFTVTEEHNGRMLRYYLRSELGVSAALLTRLKKTERGILLNGERVTVRAVIKTGDVISLDIEDTAEDENPYLAPIEMPLDIIYEDEALVAVNKPAGMVTHTTHGHYDDSLANALYAKYKAQGKAFVFRAVNRLDRETSGVVPVAKDRLSAYRMSKFLQNGRVKKEYLAVVCGRIEGEGEIKGYIARCGESIITRRTCDADTKGADYAHSVYRALISGDKYSVLLASPITGRTHQLRVHFASIGHPIVGDTLYGTESADIGRQALHALRLTFPHPRTEVSLTLTAPITDDIAKCCSATPEALMALINAL